MYIWSLFFYAHFLVLFYSFYFLQIDIGTWLKNMVKRKLVVICQSRGNFTTSSDGSLIYNGGEAHAITVSSETKFDELKSEMADMWKCDTKAVTMKYFLPNNNKTLITISSNKDIQRMIDFHEDSETVDIYVVKDDNPTTDVTPRPRNR